MAKKTKKASWLYIALGAVVGLGAVMGISRLFSEEADRSELGINLESIDTTLEGYEIVLAYDDADKILDICRYEMDNSNYRAVETGYTYIYVADFSLCNGTQCGGGGESIVIIYDYSEDPEDDTLIVSRMDYKTIFTVDHQSGISGENYTIPYCANPDEDLLRCDNRTIKMVYGERDYFNEDLYADGNNMGAFMPDGIINLVRLIAPAD